jgi:hypothetical protein
VTSTPGGGEKLLLERPRGTILVLVFFWRIILILIFSLDGDEVVTTVPGPHFLHRDCDDRGHLFSVVCSCTRVSPMGVLVVGCIGVGVGVGV